MILAIETSCDETAVALVRQPSGVEPLAACIVEERVASQIETHKAFGGVVPELAAREHTTSLPLLVQDVLRQGSQPLEAVAVTAGPGLKVCLMVGVSFAKNFAFARGLPVIPVNHLEAHCAAWRLARPYDEALYPMLTLLVSGGHTSLVLSKAPGHYQLLARTRDDAAGEAFDKAGVLLGLDYPAGPMVSALATKGNRTAYDFPRAVAEDMGSFSFSGLKTAVLRGVGGKHLSEQERADVAASVEQAIVDALAVKVELSLRANSVNSLLVSGGVAANTLLRTTLEERARTHGIEFLVPEPKWCTDNAAMVAARAIEKLEAGEKTLAASTPFGPEPRMELGSG